MTFSDYLKLRGRLQRSEGFRSREYVDSVGKQTVGFGYNLSDRGVTTLEQILGHTYTGRLTHEEATLVLEHDIVTSEGEVRKAFGWFPELDSVRAQVVIDMAFNMGLPTLRTFKQTLGAMAAGDYNRASHLMLKSKWARQVKGRAVRLANMMDTGVDDDV